MAKWYDQICWWEEGREKKLHLLLLAMDLTRGGIVGVLSFKKLYFPSGNT